MDDYQKGIHIFFFDYTWEITNQKHGCVHATIIAIRFRGLGFRVACTHPFRFDIHFI